MVTEEFQPYNFKVPATGEVGGASTEVVREIMKRNNEDVKIELMQFSDAYAIAQNTSNTVIYSIGRTPEREKLFKWIGPIGSWESAFYAKAGQNLAVSSLSDASKVGKICVVKDDAREKLLIKNGFTNLDSVASDSVCAKKLAAGDDDLWLGASTNYATVVKDAGLNKVDFRMAYIVQTNDLYIAFNKDTPDAEVAKWQASFDAMRQDGTFKKIQDDYGVD